MRQQPHDQFAKQFLIELLHTLDGEVKTNYEISPQKHCVDLYFSPHAPIDKGSSQKLEQKPEQFAKGFLAELLDPTCERVKTDYEINTPSLYVDIYFLPNATVDESSFQKLGLLGQMVRRACLLALFHHPLTYDEITDCLAKLLALYNELQKCQAQSDQKPSDEDKLPNLWILTTSVSQSLLEGFRAKTHLSEWCEGIYFFAEAFKTAIVEIQALPQTPKTLFLRALGKEITQKRAIEEILAYQADNPLRQCLLELLTVYHIDKYNFR